MKIVGIIAEFNPFHDGHKYLIEETRRITDADCVVAIMSGDFVQRGTPSFYDKWSRTEMALKGGVDLVIEMPVCYACSSAEYFARGGVKILEGLGCIDYLSFGSESGDIEKLTETSSILNAREEEINDIIKMKIRKGLSYPRARAEAMEETGLKCYAELLKDPNNILAIEYLKVADNLKPVTIKRKGRGHHQSASEIRSEIRKSQKIRIDIMEDNFYRLICNNILSGSSESLDKVLSAGAGLGNKLKNEVRYAKTLEMLVERVKSKAYTRTRVNRLLLQLVLGINNDIYNNESFYAKVLGFNKSGAAIIKHIKKTECSDIPIITNINKELYLYPEIEEYVRKDILASDIYNLITEQDLYENSDYVRKPVIIK